MSRSLLVPSEGAEAIVVFATGNYQNSSEEEQKEGKARESFFHEKGVLVKRAKKKPFSLSREAKISRLLLEREREQALEEGKCQWEKR